MSKLIRWTLVAAMLLLPASFASAAKFNANNVNQRRNHHRHHHHARHHHHRHGNKALTFLPPAATLPA